MADRTEQRLEQLEVKVAFQEHTIAQLDEVIQQALARVDELQRRLHELQAEHAASLPAPLNERPPHY